MATISKFAELAAPGVFRLGEEPLEINEDQVLIRVASCGVCKYDLTYYKGILGSFPQRVGHEPAGIIEAAGKNVTGFQVGDRVAGFYPLNPMMRAFATHAIMDPTYMIKVPDHVPLELALVEPLKCISTILRATTPEFGDYILLMGCGFMGLLTLAGLVGQGPGKIIAADIDPQRLALAAELGADITLNAGDDDFLKQVKDVTNGRGVDIAVEVTGHPGAVQLAAQALKTGRPKYVLAGWHGIPATYNLRLWTTVGAIIHSAHPNYSPDPIDDMRRAMEGLARGVFPMEKLVTHRFPLDEIQTAFELADRGGDNYVKGIILP